MLVHQIQRVPGELGATAGVTANQISILVAYTKSAANRRGQKFRRYVRVICQIRSLETFVRSAAIVTVWTRNGGIAVSKVCVSRIGCSLAKRAVLGLVSNILGA